MRRICLLLVSLSLLCLTAFAEDPEPETFTLSFVGDLALGSDPGESGVRSPGGAVQDQAGWLLPHGLPGLCRDPQSKQHRGGEHGQ